MYICREAKFEVYTNKNKSRIKSNMSLRTLKFGDRTISYDTGLNLVDASGRGKNKRNNKSDICMMSHT